MFNIILLVFRMGAKMSNQELVSIITPTYNSEDFIIGTISCVVAQTYTNWEMLIVDDCSSDSTVSLIESYIFDHHENRIRLFRNSSNKGSAYSRNRAIREAKGRWIAFLDSDDIWKERKLENQLRFMRKNGYSFSYTEYEELNCKSGRIDKYITGPKHISKNLMRKYCWVGCLTVMYDSASIGLVQVDPRLGNGCNDYPMWLGIVEKADCYLLAENLSTYRRREGSISNKRYLTLIYYLYLMYKIKYHSSFIQAVWMTFNALIFGTLKKIIFVKSIKSENKNMNMSNRIGGGEKSS